MILQIGAFFSSALSGLGTVVTEIGKQLLPVGLDIGKQYLARELSRDARRDAEKAAKNQLLLAGNSPGVSVATIGGTRQPVGGQVQRSTYTPATQAPAQSGYGNVPLAPVPVGAIGRPPASRFPMGVPGGGSSFLPFRSPSGGYAYPQPYGPSIPASYGLAAYQQRSTYAQRLPFSPTGGIRTGSPGYFPSCPY